MSKYQHYAESLDTAFKAAREKYLDAYNAVKDAEKKVEDAKTETDKRFRGEADLLREERATALHRAEAAFRILEGNVWPAFDTVRDELTQKLRAEVRADGIAVPEDLDANAMTLLQSGILRVDELEALAERYADNYTMSRIIGQHAKTAAAEERDFEKRQRLTAISRSADDGLDGVLEAWNGLLNACRTCSGRGYGEKKGNPGLVASISQKWEALTAATIAAF